MKNLTGSAIGKNRQNTGVEIPSCVIIDITAP